MKTIYRMTTSSKTPGRAPQHLAGALDSLAESIRLHGYEGEWLSNQFILDLALTVEFDEPELATDEDQIFDTLDAAFKDSPHIRFGRWEGRYRGDGPKRQHCFNRKAKARKKKHREPTAPF